jgi:molybdopterin-guanine dinucleotide biosynthesis protein A
LIHLSLGKAMDILTGIVACGGQSSRMQIDKSLLQYHMLPQRYHVYHLLKQFCADVYLSINKAQEITIESGYKYLIDDLEYENYGPISTLLTAKKKIAHSSFLLIGCDYPMLEISDIENLKSHRKADKNAICYINPNSNFIDPIHAHNFRHISRLNVDLSYLTHQDFCYLFLKKIYI